MIYSTRRFIMAEESGGSLFEVPEEALFIRVPRGRLIGVASAFLVFVVLIGALTGMPLGDAMGLMLIFTGPLAVICVYFIVMFSHVWKAYHYSMVLYVLIYVIGFALSLVIPMLLYYGGK